MQQASNSTAVALPFALFNKAGSVNGNAAGAQILFFPDGSFSIHNQDFVIQNGTLEHSLESPVKIIEPSPEWQTKAIPILSICAVVLIIVLRNVFFQAFQKFFVSLVNNYEIDFSLQKIGFTPLVLSVCIILLALADFNFQADGTPANDLASFAIHLKKSAVFIGTPLAISVVLLLFLNLSNRLFPILFSDVKSLFVVSFLALVWNFAKFGSPVNQYVATQSAVFFLGALFLFCRSILFYQVFRRSYRFRLPTTLFYICTLNLTTILFLFGGV